MDERVERKIEDGDINKYVPLSWAVNSPVDRVCFSLPKVPVLLLLSGVFWGVFSSVATICNGGVFVMMRAIGPQP